jgi:hypothetical protein
MSEGQRASRFRRARAPLSVSWLVLALSVGLEVAASGEGDAPLTVRGRATFLDGSSVAEGSLRLVGDGVDAELTIVDGLVSGKLPRPGVYLITNAVLDASECTLREPIELTVSDEALPDLRLRRPQRVEIRVRQPDVATPQFASGYLLHGVRSEEESNPLGSSTPLGWRPEVEMRLERRSPGVLITPPIYDHALVRVGALRSETKLVRVSVPLEGSPKPVDVVLHRGIAIAVQFPMHVDRSGRVIRLTLPGGEQQTYRLGESLEEWFRVTGLPEGAHQVDITYRDLRTKEWTYVERRISIVPPDVGIAIMDL